MGECLGLSAALNRKWAVASNDLNGPNPSLEGADSAEGNRAFVARLGAGEHQRDEAVERLHGGFGRSEALLQFLRSILPPRTGNDLMDKL